MFELCYKILLNSPTHQTQHLQTIIWFQIWRSGLLERDLWKMMKLLLKNLCILKTCINYTRRMGSKSLSIVCNCANKKEKKASLLSLTLSEDSEKTHSLWVTTFLTGEMWKLQYCPHENNLKIHNFPLTDLHQKRQVLSALQFRRVCKQLFDSVWICGCYHLP